VIAMNTNEIVKVTAGRERPFVRALAPAERAARPATSDDNLSFYSGHSTFAFAAAAAIGETASRRGYRGARLVWAIGFAVAATTGYLRIAADRHYLTDVLTGAATGTAIGWAVPYLRARAAGLTLAPAPLPGGAALVGSLRF
jgi:membrane-associated phospholipid phosphatase